MLLKYWHDNYTNKGRKKHVSFLLIIKSLREAFNKKNGEFSDIVQKGGRGSDKKPNFMNTEKKWQICIREGVRMSCHHLNIGKYL